MNDDTPPPVDPGKVARSRPFRDPCDDDLLGILKESMPCGTVEREGVVVGAWIAAPSRIGSVHRGGPSHFTCHAAMREGAGSGHVLTLPNGFDRRELCRVLLGGGPFVAQGGRSVPFAQAVQVLDRARSQQVAARLVDEAIRAALPIRLPAADVVRKRVLLTYMAWTQETLGAFLDGLDPEAVAFLRSVVRTELLTDHWPGLDATYGLGAPLRHAIVAYPELAHTFTESWTRSPEAFTAEMARDGVDALVRHALASVGVPRRVLSRHVEAVAAWRKHTEGGAAPKQQSKPLRSANDLFRHVLSLAADVGPSSLPRGEGAWVRFVPLCVMLTYAREKTGPALAALLGPVHDWTAFDGRLREAVQADGRRRDVEPDQFQGAEDMADAFAMEILAPAQAIAGRKGMYHRGDPIAFSLLFSGRRMVTIMREQAVWHGRRPAIDASMASLPGDRAKDPDWGAGLPDVDRDGLSLKVLTSRAELVDEGRRGTCPDGSMGLDHCVGGYASDCRAGTKRVASIRASRDGTPARLSTVEFILDGGTVRVGQHRGAGNNDPPREARRFLDVYARALRRGVLLLDRDAFAPVRDPEDGCPYDRSVPGNWEAALAAWSPSLPRWMRDLSAEGFAALADEQAARLAGTGLCWLPVSPWEARRARAAKD